MANTDINPYGQGGVMPDGYPIADNLTTNSANKALSARQGKVLKEMMVQPSTIPNYLLLGNPTDVIYTIDDFMLAHEYDQANNIDNLKFSNDLGKTWTTVTNTYGIIVNAFMFADGTFLMGCRNGNDGCKMYWTRDFSTFTEATILDYNGDPFVAENGKTRFYILKPQCKHVYVDGTEYYCFWDYIISASAPRMWYALSDETGVTIRAAFAFGYSQIDGNTISARHIHFFGYNPYDKYFYCLTGDSVSQCHVLKGRHTNHVWTWEILATGGGYKLTSARFDEGNMYAVTDYTESALAGAKGIVSIPIDKIGITTTIGGVVAPAKMRYLFHATPSFMGSAALSAYITDNNGWRFAGTDYLGGSRHLIAKGNHNFMWVDNDKGVKFDCILGPNNQGDVIAAAVTPGGSYTGDSWLKMSHMTHYNLTEAMRRSGATDFFEGWRGTLY